MSPKASNDGPVLGLVGKGITFDTGGISIKPADNMEKMKYDMAGGAAMLGAMRAIALLKPKVRVIGIVCAAENMPDGKAHKPGDVQTAMLHARQDHRDHQHRCRRPPGPGRRPHLCAPARRHPPDRRRHAHRRHRRRPGHDQRRRVLQRRRDLSRSSHAALATSGEKFWRLPLGDEYADMIKSDIGDIKNTGGRYGGAITAAEFLNVFAEDTPWIHLDIAGLAWIDDTQALHRQRPQRRRRPLHPGVGAELFRLRRVPRAGAGNSNKRADFPERSRSSIRTVGFFHFLMRSSLIRALPCCITRHATDADLTTSAILSQPAEG